MKKLLLILSCLSICAQDLPSSWSQSYSTYDIAESYLPDEYTIGFGIDNYCIYCFTGDTLNYDERKFDIWTRFGLFKKTEMEIKYSYPTCGLISLKYQFLQKYLTSAFKFGFGYMKGTREGLITDYVYDFYPTLLLNKNLFSNIKLYLAPKIIYSIHARDRQEHSDRPPRYIFQYGFGIGLALGKRFQLLPETNWLAGNNQGVRYIVNQFGIGANLKIN